MSNQSRVQEPTASIFRLTVAALLLLSLQICAWGEASDLRSQIIARQEVIKAAAEERNIQVITAAVREVDPVELVGFLEIMRKAEMTPREQAPVWREILLKDDVWSQDQPENKYERSTRDQTYYRLNLFLTALFGRGIRVERPFEPQERAALVARLDKEILTEGKPD